MALAELLRETRKERGDSLREASVFFDVTQTTVRSWEFGMTTPSYERLEAIARYCRVPMSQVLQEVGAISEARAARYAEADEQLEQPDSEDMLAYEKSRAVTAA